MIPGMGAGGFSASTSATSGADGGTAGGIGDKFTTVGGKVDTGLFSNSGIKFGNKGIDPNMLMLGAVVLGALFFLKK